MRLEEFFGRVYRALGDRGLRAGLERARRQRNIWLILEKYPYLERVREEVRRVKEESVSRLGELVEEARASLEERGAVVHFARDAEEARRIVGGIVGSGKVVVKSKTMVGEEVGIREYLTSLGNEVWETDLGELLIQLAGERPMHPVAPALHMTRGRVAGLVRKLGLEPGSEEPAAITAVVRRFLREKIMRADYGLSGANAVSADTGTLFLVENEGNIRLTTGVPERHVALVSVEKVVPTFMDAVKVVMLQAAFSGLYPPVYVNLVSGPSKTGDIEYRIVRGAQGPRELHVVFLDNGRLAASKDPLLREQLYCIKCGRCILDCPVYTVVGNAWGGGTYPGPMGVGWSMITEGDAHPLSLLCTQCGKCVEVCPLRINMPEIIRRIRGRYIRSLM